MAQIHWLDLLIAPLTWLERARGRRRLALLLLYALILSVGGVLVGREVALWQLPDAPEPFDLAKYGHVNLADTDNAMVLYAQAAKLLIKDPKVAPLSVLVQRAGKDWDWTRASPEVRSFVESNGAAITLWLRGTIRPDAALVQPDLATLAPPLIDIGDLRILAYLGTLEATRRQAKGDLSGAWTYFRGVIRSGIHAGCHGGLGFAAMEGEILGPATLKVIAWVDDPRVTPQLLRQAVGDLTRSRQMMSSVTDMIRMEYFQTRADLDRPNERRPQLGRSGDSVAWLAEYLGVMDFLRNEPKLSQRILRLITAGQLAQSERPIDSRPQVISPRYLIYAIDAATPSRLARIDPEKLVAWADASQCRDAIPEFSFFLMWVQAARNRFESLRLHLAERAYALDHGGQPAKTYGDLVSAYLDALPTGVTAGDLLSAP